MQYNIVYFSYVNNLGSPFISKRYIIISDRRIEMERKLASIQIVDKIEKINGADRIEILSTLGWHSIVKCGEFAIGDKIIFIEPDSILPQIPYFDFMERYKYRVKTIKMRGVYSQGLAIPLSVFPDIKGSVGDDVTELLGVKKYDPYTVVSMGLVNAENKKRNFPSFIPKTDEERIQNIPFVLEKYRGISCVISEKLDGSSSTYYSYEGKFGVCSHNVEWEQDDTNIFWRIAIHDNLEYKLQCIGDIVIQGEIVGRGIQKNPYNIDGYKLYLFSVYDIQYRRYREYEELLRIASMINMETVPILVDNYTLDTTVDDLVESAKGQSHLNPKHEREGIVIRPVQEMYDPKIGRLSFKVINPDYLLKCQ